MKNMWQKLSAWMPSRGELKALVAALVLAVLPSAWAEGNFVRAVFSHPGQGYDGTSSIWEAEDAEIVEDLADVYAIRSDMPTTTTWAYGTYMLFEGGVTYLFRSHYDDHATVKIDEVDLLPQAGECVDRYAAIAFPETGWHKVELRFANNGGNGGCTSTSYCGVLYKKGTGNWMQFLAANGQLDATTLSTTAPEGSGSIAASYAYMITLSGNAAFISETVVAPEERPTFLGSYRLFPSKMTFTDTSVTDIVFGDDVYVVINSGTFRNYSTIKTIDIKYGYIGSSAFLACKNLTSVHLGGVEVADSAFSACTALTDLQLDGTTIGSSVFDGCTALASVALRGTLGQYAFKNCTGLTTAEIGGSVGSYAFQACSALVTAKISGSVGACAFDGCTSLKTLEVSGNVAEYACRGLGNLETLTLKAGVQEIGAGAFASCSGMTGQLELPDGLTKITTIP